MIVTDGPMKKENAEEYRGGTKKFLYSGPKPRETASEDQWGFANNKKNSTPPTNSGVGVDLEEVWSIKKNVTVTKQGALDSDGLSLNVGKGYYSRYGHLKDTDESRKKGSSPADVHNKTWGQGKSFSYSYANNDVGRNSQNSNRSDEAKASGMRQTQGGRNGMLGGGRYGNM